MIHILTGTYQVIDPLFGVASRSIELDMGCGKGGFTLALARRFPERLILGSDVMLGRLRRVFRKAEREGLTNLHLLRANNRDLVAFLLPPHGIDRVHLLCPDPWPKGRHRHNRLVTTDFLTRIGRILKPGGCLHLSTDHEPYLKQWEGLLTRLDFFREASGLIADVADMETDFERRWCAEGRQVRHLSFQCLGQTQGKEANHEDRHPHG